jgi:hypothetical protein
MMPEDWPDGKVYDKEQIRSLRHALEEVLACDKLVCEECKKMIIGVLRLK